MSDEIGGHREDEGKQSSPEAERSPSPERSPRPLTRRDLLRASAFGAVGLAAGAGALGLGRGARAQEASAARRPGGATQDTGQAGTDRTPPAPAGARDEGRHDAHLDQVDMLTSGDVDLSDFDPTDFLTDFDYGEVSTLPSGQTLREYEIVALDKEVEVAPGVFFPAWTYDGQVPGPTLRCTEGDRVRVRFANAGSHPHTIHFHGIHAADMDGVFEIVEPGMSFVYEFDAAPAGLQLYHCHAVPLKRHIHKGLYGTFIIDPKEPVWEPAREMVMVMNGFDTNFDGDNEVYAANTVAFHYQRHPIEIEKGELVRIFLVNTTEFDLINSFHLHGNFFRYWKTGTRPEQYEWTDTVMLCQGERGIMEFTFDHTGPFMFHAHQSEFAELGWMGLFDVKDPTVA